MCADRSDTDGRDHAPRGHATGCSGHRTDHPTILERGLRRVSGPAVVEETVTAWYARDQLRDDITGPAPVVRLAVEDRTPIGFGHTGPIETDDMAGLHRRYVVSDRWGEEIGRRLFEVIETTLTVDGFDTIKLAVLVENEIGVGVYETVGCERLSLTARHDVSTSTGCPYVRSESIVRSIAAR